MEMDRQTILVLFAAIIGLTLFGTMYLAPSKHDVQARPTYAENDIRHKFQVEDAKNAKKKQGKAVTPVMSSGKSSSSSSSSSSDDGASENEEPPLDNDETAHEEPPIE